jgi:hypothetical protein
VNFFRILILPLLIVVGVIVVLSSLPHEIVQPGRHLKFWDLIQMLSWGYLIAGLPKLGTSQKNIALQMIGVGCLYALSIGLCGLVLEADLGRLKSIYRPQIPILALGGAVLFTIYLLINLQAHPSNSKSS